VIFLVAFSDLLNLEPMNNNIDSVCVLLSCKLYPLITYEAAWEHSYSCIIQAAVDAIQSSQMR